MKQNSKKPTVVRKQLPTAALWAGAIIAPVLCLTSLLELIIEGSKMTGFSIAWSVFVIGFTAFYSYDFAKLLRARLEQERNK